MTNNKSHDIRDKR